MTIDERGHVSILAAGLALLCLAIAGLAIDGTRAFLARRSLQNAADAAALAGAGEIDTRRYYRSGGSEVMLLSDGARDRAMDMFSRRGVATAVYVSADTDGVEVIARSRITTSFLKVIGIDSIPIAASGRAEPFSQRVPIGR